MMDPDVKIDLKVVLQFKSKKEGGRLTAAHSGYRATLLFPFGEATSIAAQFFEETELVMPGESVTADLSLISPEHFHNSLYPGLDFEFAEGEHVVGSGTIMKVINPDLKR